MRHPINARFWVWYGGDWVKLTLRPGDRREVTGGVSTDEGYSCMSEVYEHLGDRVRSELSQWGRDCDGRYEYSSDAECPITELRAREGHDGTPIPEWRQVFAGQRDYTAEMAGY
jgi:hypothetical protein